MAMFVKRETVAVFLPEDPDNIIFIRTKMDVGTRARVQDAAAKVTMKAGVQTTDMSVLIGAYNLASLTENIVAWQGPAFDGVPCTPEHIAMLDPDEPLIDRVLTEIGTRNAKASNDPKATTPSLIDGGEN
jgi:hypothetical protein